MFHEVTLLLNLQNVVSFKFHYRGENGPRMIHFKIICKTRVRRSAPITRQSPPLKKMYNLERGFFHFLHSLWTLESKIRPLQS